VESQTKAQKLDLAEKDCQEDRELETKKECFKRIGQGILKGEISLYS